jgi:uncharacterized membrane protein
MGLNLYNNRAKRNEFLILLLCLLIGFALRFYTFDQKSLWIDEIHTFNDSRDDLKGQIKYYKENPTYLHPPLFYILTHLFYPFQKPERDLRIIPLIFGILSIPMIYFLSRLFSPHIALPCAVSLTFMTYHIGLSQDGRSYSLLMFTGMAGLYFLINHLKTLKVRYLLPAGLFFAILFHTSYSSIPFIFLCQMFWLYRIREDDKKPPKSSFLIFNGLILILSIPWLLFVVFHSKGQALMDPHQAKAAISFLNIIHGIFNDWLSNVLLMIVSMLVIIFFPFFSKHKRNATVLLGVFFLSTVGFYLFCKLLGITHFVMSRYFINFLPLLLITIYLSINAFEVRFERLRRFVRLTLLFIIFFIVSNLVLLPFYYRSQKQDFKGLVIYLKGQLREGDKIFTVEKGNMPGILHYFGAYPEGRSYIIPF